MCCFSVWAGVFPLLWRIFCMLCCHFVGLPTTHKVPPTLPLVFLGVDAPWFFYFPFFFGEIFQCGTHWTKMQFCLVLSSMNFSTVSAVSLGEWNSWWCGLRWGAGGLMRGKGAVCECVAHAATAAFSLLTRKTLRKLRVSHFCLSLLFLPHSFTICPNFWLFCLLLLFLLVPSLYIFSI